MTHSAGFGAASKRIDVVALLALADAIGFDAVEALRVTPSPLLQLDA
jgi:hypothetical protein